MLSCCLKLPLLVLIFPVISLIVHVAECQDLSKTTNTETEVELDDNALKLTKIAIISGGVVGFILFWLIVYRVVKKYFCKSISSSNNCNNEGENRDIIRISIPEVSTPPPSYDDIHHYKQLDLTMCTPIYYNIPGMKNYYGILLKTTDIEEKDGDENDPPSYHDIVQRTNE